MLFRGEIDNATMVHDEDAGVSLKLGTLLAQPLNNAKLVAAQISHKWTQHQAAAGTFSSCQSSTPQRIPYG